MVVERLEIDGDAEWRADLVLTTIEFADSGAVIVNRSAARADSSRLMLTTRPRRSAARSS
jgi:hypothetical protein